MSTRLSFDIVVNAPAEAVFDALSQWARQDEWMLGTKVEVRSGDGRSTQSELAAWTGIGPVGFWDTMTITRWERPYRIDVLHTGSVVRGPGAMEVLALPDGRSRFVWREELELPPGPLARLGWPLVKPAIVASVKQSLRKFASLVETGTLPR